MTSDSQLYLVGFTFAQQVNFPQLYTISVDDDRPILLDGVPLMFADPDLGEQALRTSNCGAASIGPARSEVAYVFHFGQAIHTLQNEEVAPDAMLLDCCNALLDFHKCMADFVPREYNQQLGRFADHLTFDLDLASYFQDSGIARQQLLQIFFWSLGALHYHAIIVDEAD